jgi:tRNA pseudouridine38-40 synthase
MTPESCSASTQCGGSGVAAPRNVRLDLSYRGSTFAGFADNPEVATVERVLVQALEKVLRHPVSMHVAGRTDRGVHATGQVVNFETNARHFDPARLRGALNKLCAPDISVSLVTEVGADFHARFSAVGRTYRYRVLVADVPDPMRSDLVWLVPPQVSIDVLETCAPQLVGAHDFGGFCRRSKAQPDASMIRRVFAASWTEVGDEVQFEISGNAFCHQMVRSIVGTCVTVARGKMDVAMIDRLLITRDRTLAADIAPPQGLALEQVMY